MNNQIKIIYDPYEKTVQYQYRNSPDKPWDDLSPAASLASEEFASGTLQNRAEEIVEELRKNYCTDGRGVDLFFAGTAPDWEDLKETVGQCAPDGRITCRDRIERLNAPDEILSKIQDIFEHLSGQLSSIQDSKIREPIDRYRDTVKPGINLVVTGIYSAGKSSFINALIGEELLPVSSNPTTAKIFKIVPRPSGSWADTVIRFQYKDTDVELRFNKDGYYVRTKELQQVLAGSPLKERLDEVRGTDGPSPAYLYRIVEALNGFTEDGALSETIEIDTPFYHSTLPLSQYEFVIYDTPGSDSAKHREHYDILKEALKGQTNGLPILVTDPDHKDSTSVEALRKDLTDIQALDLSNIMVVINKADEKGPDTLEAIRCQDFAARTGAQKGVFVLSSLVGLGAKKKDMSQCAFRDTSLLFKRNKGLFLDGDMQLFQYNVYSRHLRTPVNAVGEKANAGTDDWQKLLHNSGIWAVEYGIGDFAGRYAASNKCQQAQVYLSQAIEIAKDELKQKTQREKQNRNALQQEFNSKETQLVRELEKTAKDQLDELLNACKDRRKKAIEDHSLSKDKLAARLKDAWGPLSKKDSDRAKNGLKRYIDSLIQERLSTVQSAMSGAVNASVGEGIQRFKTACIQVVKGSDAIGEEEQRFLSQYIMDCPAPGLHTYKFSSKDLEVSSHQFLFWKWTAFDKNKCADNVKKSIEDAVANGSQAYGGEVQEGLTRWKETFISNLTLKLADFNPELRDKQAKLQESMDEVKRLSDTMADMEQKLEEIHELFQFSE